MSSVQQPTKVPAQIITKDEVPAYSMYGLGEAKLLMTGERSNGQWWLGHFREDPGFVTPLHMHPKTDEQFYVLDGVLSVFLDGQWMEIMPGTLAIVPRGTPHAQGSCREDSCDVSWIRESSRIREALSGRRCLD